MKNVLLFLFSISIVNATFAQIEAVSPTYSFSIKKKIEPPILDFVAGSLQFKDADGNNAINANEQCSIEFQLQNTGTGDGLNLKALVKVVGTTSGITIAASTQIANCAKGKTVSYILPITGNMNTVDGKIEISIDIEEPNGLNPPIQLLEIDTKKFVAPAVSVVDFVLTSEDGSKTLELRKKIILQLLLQNTGQGVAKEVRVKMPLPENVLPVNAEEISVIGDLLRWITSGRFFVLALIVYFPANSARSVSSPSFKQSLSAGTLPLSSSLDSFSIAACSSLIVDSCSFLSRIKVASYLPVDSPPKVAMLNKLGNESRALAILIVIFLFP